MPGRKEVEEKKIKLKQPEVALSSNHFSQKIDESYLKPLIDIAKKMNGKSNGKKVFNFYQWIQLHIKKQSHPGAMLKIGQGIYDLWDDIKDPWAYAEKVMSVENGNFNEKDRVKEHEVIKDEWQAWEQSPAAQKVRRLLNKSLARAP